jgi:hypothetical protein
MGTHEKGSKIMLLMKDKHKKIMRRKSRAQSLVEFAITLPMLLILFSGLVEFGFALNYYLSLLDATREAARFYSNSTPFNPDTGDPDTGVEDPTFYSSVAAEVYANLDPSVRPGNESYSGRQIILDPTKDEIVVSAFGWDTTNPGALIHYPRDTTFPFRQWGNSPSKFTDAMILAQMPTGSPNAGLLVVEVHHYYNPLLVRLWLRTPLLMRAYTVMPFAAVEPR